MKPTYKIYQVKCFSFLKHVSVFPSHSLRNLLRSHLVCYQFLLSCVSLNVNGSDVMELFIIYYAYNLSSIAPTYSILSMYIQYTIYSITNMVQLVGIYELKTSYFYSYINNNFFPKINIAEPWNIMPNNICC